MDYFDLLIFPASILIGLLAVGVIIARLYRRSSKETSFVRTGFGGQRVIVNGGALVLPVLHETIPVNMNTLRLEVTRANEQALITRDRMRVDVQAEFYVRVQPTAESIANAAQTLGQRTMHPEALKELVEGKFVDALRAVAAEMAMEELHEQRVAFVQKVQAAVSEDILKNGLELESVSLTGLDQTKKDYFNPSNAFDAEGLTKLTQEIEERRKKRNDIEQETEVLIARKNLEAEQEKLQIERDDQYARLEQERELQIRRAAQAAEIAREQAERQRESKEALIASDRSVNEAGIAAEQVVAERKIAMEQQVELAEQDRSIVVAEKSRENSEAAALADEARAVAARAAELVITARDTERADREKAIELIEARKGAEMQAISITVAAEAEKQAADDRAAAIRVAAEADSEKVRIEAVGQAEAGKLRAEGQRALYEVEAEGKRAVNEASNVLSADQIAMQVRVKLIESLPEIIAQSVKPIENIDGIKIIQVDGLRGNGGGEEAGAAGTPNGNGSLADQMVNSALNYRAQAPLLDAMLKDIGLSGGDINGFVEAVAPTTEAKPAPEAIPERADA